MRLASDEMDDTQKRRTKLKETRALGEAHICSASSMSAATLALAGAQEGRIAAVHPLVRGCRKARAQVSARL
jgi:hypothetical protein